MNAVREDPVQPGLLYAATERAVWTSLDDGAHWLPLEYNLPHTSMRDLLVKDGDLVVATHGRSFWILDDITPLRTMTADLSKKLPMLFAPAPAWRIRRDTNTDTPLPPEEPAGTNPPNGAIVDYDLPHGASGLVALEILDSSGKVLRRYTSDDPVIPTPQDLRTNLIPPYWPKMHGPLPTTAGMHRWVWDLHETTPTATNYSYPISAVPHRTPLTPQGPLLLPGAYTVRFTVDGHSESVPLVVKMDPRVHVSSADLEALHTVQEKMAASLDALSKADLAVHSVSEQLADPQNQSIEKDLTPYKAALNMLLDGSDEHAAKKLPGLDDVTSNAAKLYDDLQQADAAPTVALIEASEQVKSEERELLPEWESFQQKQLPALNRILNNAHRPPINLNRPPENMPEQGDED